MGEYSFKGINLKTEIILGFVAGIICLFTIAIVIYFYVHKFLGYKLYNIPIFLTIGAICTGLLVSSFILRILGRKFSRLWKVFMEEDSIQISYNDKIIAEFNILEIEKVVLSGVEGNKGFKYLMIYYLGKKVSLRVGKSMWMPFSTIKDINKFNSFLNDFSDVLEEKGFSKKRTEIITGAVSTTWNRL